MRLSEREKKYVLILAVLLLLAALYYFFTAAVEPFLQRRAEVAIELADLQQQEMLQQAKLKRLDSVKEELDTKTDEAMKLVEPFYPALPQDRLMLLMQDLVLQSGLEVASIQFSGTTVAEPGMVQQMAAPLTYPLKTLAEQAGGVVAVTPAEGEAAPPVDATAGQYAVPQAVFTLNYTGSHEQVVAFLQACEGLNRTVAISSLNEAKGGETVVEGEAEGVAADVQANMSGTLTVSFHAVEKPVYDAFMDWTLERGEPKTELFVEQYSDMVEGEAATGTEEPVVETP